MGQEINLLNSQLKTVRDYDTRFARRPTKPGASRNSSAKSFFDGLRSQGYGGYRYDGRWKDVARRMMEYYRLPKNAAILDVGYAKGFLLADWMELYPECTVAGVDVSTYATDHAIPSVKPFLKVASAENCPIRTRASTS